MRCKKILYMGFRATLNFRKSISQNTNQFTKTQINFPKHKLIYQNTNQFTKTQNNFSQHKPIFQHTNQFTKTQINFSKHKPISRTQIKRLGTCSVIIREPGKDSFPGFSASNMATSNMLKTFENVLPQLWVWSVIGLFVSLSMWNKVRHCCFIFSITVVFRKCNGKGGRRGLLTLFSGKRGVSFIYLF